MILIDFNYSESEIQFAFTLWIIIFTIADSLGTFQLIRKASKRYGIKNAIEIEQNPILRFLIKKLGLVSAIALNLIVATITNAYIAITAPIYLSGILLGFYLAVVIYHVSEYRAFLKYERMEQNSIPN